MITKEDLPLFNLVSYKVERTQTMLTALELFVLNHQPENPGSANIWRNDLADVLTELTVTN